MRARRLIRALAIPAACGIALTTSGTAQAHYVYYADQVWSNADSSYCLWNYSETSHGSTGGGYFKGEARSQADSDLNPLDCILPYERNTGWLAEGFVIHKWYVDAQGDGSWLICDRTDKWFFNTEPASTFRLYGNAPAEGLCGPGEYGLTNFASMKIGGEWVGSDTGMWSGYHLLPDNSLVANGEGGPPAPNWVKENGTANPPAKLPKADSNGNPAVNSKGEPIMADARLPQPNKSNGTTDGKRTVGTNKNGEVTETVTVDLNAS